jgi:S1-C subfamily serine protease
MPKFRTAILCCCCLLAAPSFLLRAQEAAGSPQSTMSPQAAHDLLHQLDDAFASVFEKVAPSVVIVEADKKPSADDQDQDFDFFFHTPESGDGSTPQPPADAPSVRSEGSGFIVRPDGYIYTNFHVIEDAEKIDVKLRDNRHFSARLVGADERTDIAVLKIDATDLPTVALLDSDSIRIGQMCFAIGIPYNLDYSFCRGIVSAKGRGNLTSTPTKPMYEDYIQTDAFINPGNSGGPLFDIDGRVMGMNTLINGLGRGLSFAIPSNMLDEVGRQIIATGHATHPWLGVVVDNLEDVPSGSFMDQGVVIETIEADTPAYKSDLRPQDIILKVDGVQIQTAHDLQHEILRKKIGQSVTLTIQRGRKTFDIAVVTDKLPDDIGKVAQSHYKAKRHPGDATSYGLEFAPAHAGQTEAVHDKLNGGLVITAVAPDSPAGRAGVHPGDVLTAVDQHPVIDTNTCLALLAAHRGTTGPVLFITRDGHKGSTVLDTGDSDSEQ